MEISAGAEQLDVNQQLQTLMEQALALPEARDEISAKRMRIDVVGQSCTLPLDNDEKAVVVGKVFAAPGTPEGTYVRTSIDPEDAANSGHYYEEIRFLKNGGEPNIFIVNGKQMHRTVYSPKEKDMRMQLAMLTLDRAITEANNRRGERQHDVLPEIKWKDDVARFRKFGRAVMKRFKRQ